jgi:hypothetical protein
MSQWTHGDHEPDPESQEQDAGYVRRSRILYWWPAPVSSDRSAKVGKKMLIGTVSWFAILAVVLAIIAVIVAATG